MFYSQFILAKKGPLGTIWIAAHLERKLRKNQVADTDIGVSVDSILFPEVPIALRLSSHLLLGVVRIYSKKVNYLFHDCSEALLKVKQAFRSTAVDLPPEESTAPYHSITLPETFDLDDFELPVSALLNGDFDDRHISTKEQITLQDTLDNAGYSTSQFGLDDRFGDGDASQIGLDLDEELFLDKDLTVQQGSVSLVSEYSEHQQQDASHLTEMDIDDGPHGYNEGRGSEASKDLSELLCNERGKNVVSNVENLIANDSSHRLIFNIQTPDLNEVFLPEDHVEGPSAVSQVTDMDFAADDPPSPEFNESANFPTMPGLMEEALPTGAQDLSASDPQRISQHTELESNKLDNPINEEVERPDATHIVLVHAAAATSPKMTNLAQLVCSPNSVLAESKPDAGVPQPSGAVLPSPDPVNDNGHVQDRSSNSDLSSTVPVLPASCSTLAETTLDLRASQVGLGSLDTNNDKNLLHYEIMDYRPGDIHQVSPSSTLVLTEEAPVPEVTKGSDGGIAAAPSVIISDSTMSTRDTQRNGFISNETSSHPISMYNSLVSELSSGTVSVSLGDSTRLLNPDQGHVQDVNSSNKINFSALSSDFHLMPCTSELNQPSLISPGATGIAKNSPGISFTEPNQPSLISGGAMGIAENAPGIFFTEPSCNLSTPVVGQGLNYSGFSVGLQGGDFPSGFTTNANVVVQQNSNSLLLGFRPDFNNTVEMSSSYISNVQSGHTDCFSGSGYPEPERMMFAPSVNFNPPNVLGQQTAQRGAMISNGSVKKNNSLSGQKRNLIASTPDLQSGLSTKARKRRNNDSVPNDDDLLASILVGRTPSLMIGPTPPVPKPTYLKRPRSTPKVPLAKRKKVLLDDTVVLHADAIRLQLINTEDIRRTRKKASCTRPEIWRIHKDSLEDEIFSESMFTGISEQLNGLITRKYDNIQNICPQIDERHSSVDASKELGHSKASELVKGSDNKEMGVQSELLPERVAVPEPSSTSELVDIQSCPNTLTVDAQEHVESDLNQNQKESSGNVIADAELDALGHPEVELVTRVAPNSGVDCEVPTDARLADKCDDRCADPSQNSLNEMIQTCHDRNEIEPNLHVVACTSKDFTYSDQAGGGLAAVGNSASLEAEDLSSAKQPSFAADGMDVDIVNPANLVHSENGPADVNATENGARMLDTFGGEVRADVPIDSAVAVGFSDLSAPDMTGGGEPTSVHCQVMKDSEGVQVMAGSETVANEEKMAGSETFMNEEKTASEAPCEESPNMPSLPVPCENERVPSAAGENSCMNVEGGLDVESTPMESSSREPSDFCSAIDDIDTDFLNVDDEVDYDEDTNNDVPNTEAAQSLENSGWSVRTRGVAKYLKNMFDEESGRGRKSLAIDNLLAGKTRKEASRMFFETLVLKTKDYIHVEQENPLDYINIKPRLKLLKSEF